MNCLKPPFCDIFDVLNHDTSSRFWALWWVRSIHTRKTKTNCVSLHFSTKTNYIRLYLRTAQWVETVWNRRVHITDKNFFSHELGSKWVSEWANDPQLTSGFLVVSDHIATVFRCTSLQKLILIDFICSLQPTVGKAALSASVSLTGHVELGWR